MIKAILFDWGGVLIDNPTEELMEFCARELGVNGNAMRAAFSVQEKHIQTGKISENEMWKRICASVQCFPPQEVSLWQRAVENVFHDKSETWTLLEQIRTKGYKTGFLSNTEEGAMRYFHKKEYGKYFDAVIFSCVEGVIKPEPKIYEIALEKFQVKPNETVFIDDKPANIQGAQDVGMHGIVFQNIAQLKQELQNLGVK